MRTVLLCIPMLNNAGAQRFVAELAMNLDKTKYKAVVVTTRKSLPDSDFHRLLLVPIHLHNSILFLYL